VKLVISDLVAMRDTGARTSRTLPVWQMAASALTIKEHLWS
jgi:hypothetical protein